MNNKRNLYEELKQGIEEIQAHQAGKLTLRTCSLQKKPIPQVDARFIREMREALHMSRNVFALKLRVSARTLEKWEQGQTRPNDQAAVLLLMVRRYPDMLRRLEDL